MKTNAYDALYDILSEHGDEMSAAERVFLRQLARNISELSEAITGQTRAADDAEAAYNFLNACGYDIN